MTSAFQVFENPNRGENALCCVHLPLQFTNNAIPATLELVYSPDKEITAPIHLKQWLDEHTQQPFQTWEHIAGILLNEFYHTLLPKFVFIEIESEHDDIIQSVHLHKIQPNYTIPESLKERL